MPGELSAKVDDFLKHVHPMDQERFRVMLVSAQERAGVRIRTDFRMRHADNSWRWFELEAASVPNADGRTLRCVGLARDVSDAKRAHERLLHDAVHCSLTGLPNRELFLDRLRGVVARAKTENNVRPSIIFIDLDKFKSVNSSFGLVRGDSLLLTVARRLQRHLGPHDTVARVGGDQFAMLFIGEQEARNLAALAERVRRSLRAPIPLANQEIILTGSIGVAIFDGEEQGDGDLLKEAELAMYRAKRGGADRIEVFAPAMRRDRDDRVQIESDLRKALERNQLKVLYQPIVYLPTKELAGFEALVRWEHPKLGLLNPVAFVPVAEESDLIIKLGSHVLLRAAHDASRWQIELPREDRPLFVSVNVSSRQLFRPESVQEIRHILGRNIVPKGALRLEITESLVMENPEQAVEVLEALRASGADLALDDFGTGYSSLAYLQRFPFDTIKVDRELVRGSSSANGAAIMRSIVALAHELGKRVVAEGVEQAEEAAFLRGIGCEYAQGFHFGEPIPERDVIQLLKMVRKSEKKMQPRGFFRPKTKAKKDIAALPAPVPAPLSDAPPAPLPAAGKTPSALVNRTVRHRHQREANGAALAAEFRKPTAPVPVPRPDVQVAAARIAKAMLSSPPLPVIAVPQVRTAPPSVPRSRPPMPPQSSNGLGPLQSQSPSPAPGPLTDALARAVGPPPVQPPPLRHAMPPPPPPQAIGAMGPPALPRSGPPQNGAQNTAQNGTMPDYSSLPPGVAASLARLAGVHRPAEVPRELAPGADANPAAAVAAAAQSKIAGS